MPFFRVRTAFCGPPVIPHCKDIRFRVIAGYPDYGSSYHFTESYAGGRRRGIFSAYIWRPFPLLPFVSAVPFRFGLCVCCRLCRLFLLLLFGPASAVRSRFRRLFPLVPSASPALCRATKKPAAITGPQAFRSRRFSPSGSAIRLRARIRRCRKFCSDWD